MSRNSKTARRVRSVPGFGFPAQFVQALGREVREPPPGLAASAAPAQIIEGCRLSAWRSWRGLYQRERQPGCWQEAVRCPVARPGQRGRAAARQPGHDYAAWSPRVTVAALARIYPP
jgi:hypothetical protein